MRDPAPAWPENRGKSMTTEPLLMNLENNVYLEDEALIIIDRRKLPRTINPVYCTEAEEVAGAIREMMVQGAGDIAITAGYGLYLAARRMEREGRVRDRLSLEKAASLLKATRPTGFHLAALLEKLMQRVDAAGADRAPSEVIREHLARALDRQQEISRETGRHGETLLEDGDTILTHCFAGAGLLYMLRFAGENGKDIKVLCTETRPYLQGARLTAWSVSEMGIDTTLITDNMAAWPTGLLWTGLRPTRWARCRSRSAPGISESPFTSSGMEARTGARGRAMRFQSRSGTHGKSSNFRASPSAVRR